MKIDVTVPGLLADSVGGQRCFEIEATTLSGALRFLRDTHPRLRVHVWDEADQIRQHVLVYYNDESVKWIDDPSAVCLKQGDRIAIIQAVSGG